MGSCYACFEHVMDIRGMWVHVMHVLNMLWILGVCNMSLDKLCYLWNIHNMECDECKMCPVMMTQWFLENMNGAKGKLGEKIVPIACNFFVRFNIFGGNIGPSAGGNNCAYF